MKFMRSDIESLHETLNKLTKGKDNLDIILSNQGFSYNKANLVYQPNNNVKSYIHKCHANKKLNQIVYKYIFCRNHDHIQPCCFTKMHYLRWSNAYISNDSRHLKYTKTKVPKKIWIPKIKT